MPFDLNSTGAKAAFGAILLVVGLVAGWILHRAIFSPPDVPTLLVYDDWRFACPRSTEKNASCTLTEDVLEAKSHSEIAQLGVSRVKGGNQLTVILPYNVLLEPGIGLSFGEKDKPAIYQYEVCDGGGCIVRIPLDDKLVKRLTAPKAEPRILFAGMDGKPVGLPFSVKGFRTAFNAYLSAEARRHSWFRRLWS
jgi:invasion protein IalB